MAVEIEIKAWVRNKEGIEQKLREECKRVRAYRKEDRYFRGPELAGRRSQDFRLRLDGDKAVCTFKDKSISNGLELSGEEEFEISSPEVFIELIRRLGCRKISAKKKSGVQYNCGGLSVELSEVEPIGCFIEVEKIIPERDVSREREIEKQMRDFLQSLGIDEGDIEERPYNALLNEKKSRD